MGRYNYIYAYTQVHTSISTFHHLDIDICTCAHTRVCINIYTVVYMDCMYCIAWYIYDYMSLQIHKLVCMCVNKIPQPRHYWYCGLRIFLCGRVCLAQYRIFNTIPHLYPLDAISTHTLVIAIKISPRHCQMLGVWDGLPPAGNHCSALYMHTHMCTCTHRCAYHTYTLAQGTHYFMSSFVNGLTEVHKIQGHACM